MSKPSTIKCLGVMTVSLFGVAIMSFYSSLHLVPGIVLVVLVQGLLISVCQRLIVISEQDMEQKNYIFSLFQSGTIILATFIIYLISEGGYTQKIEYLYWLIHLFDKNIPIIQFEIATYLWVSYLLVIGLLFRKQMIKMIVAKIDTWVPPGWTLIIAIVLIIYTRTGFNHFVRVNSLVIGGLMLILTLFIRRAKIRMYQIRYVFKPKTYLVTFNLILVMIWGIGANMPRWQELPGTRWLKNLRNSFGTQAELKDYLPISSALTKDLVLSDVVLFEVETNEPLYLREVAYKIYENNMWRLDEEDKIYDTDMPFKSSYLQAEYEQTSTILNEMAWIRAQNPNIFREYKEILNRESSPSLKKKYTINQNPINTINYFTVNGTVEIRDRLAKSMYYCGSLENIYIHSNRLVEPTSYQVTYYDRMPKKGTREYSFLKGLTYIQFVSLCEQLHTYRGQGVYMKEIIPRLLRTYTPLIQYQRAEQGYLQIPDNIKDSLYKLSKKATVGEISGFGQAEALCNYLKENYTYNLQSKPISEEDNVYQFLFSQKEGVCQDFASSMVLMCRSIGIPARYVTGYLVTEKKEGTSSTYVVRQKDAHAYAEVYIPAYGWMLFDPTPPIVAEEVETQEAEKLIIGDFLKLIGGMIIIMLFITFGIYGFKGLKIVYWLVLLCLKPTKWGIESLLRKTLWRLENKGFPKKPKETIRQYQKRMLEEGFDIGLIVRLFERSTFGYESPERKELKQALYTYRKVIKTKKLPQKGARIDLPRIH